MSDHDQREDYDDEPWRNQPKKREDILQTTSDNICTLGFIQLIFSVVIWAVTVVLAGFAVTDSGAGNNPRPSQLAVAGAVSAVSTVWNYLVVSGARAMARCQNYRLAILAAVLATVPVPFVYCLPVSVPFGIAAIVVLRRPAIRARFDFPGSGTAPTDRC